MDNTSEHSKSNIPRNSLYLLLSSVVGMGLGFTFWLLLSSISNPELVGMTSSTATLANMVSGIILLGIPTGSRRGLGIARAERKMGQFKTILVVSLIILSLVVTLASAVLLVFLQQTSQVVGLSEQLILLAIIIMVFMSSSAVLKGGFIANLESGTLFVAEAISSVARIACAVLLVSGGFGAFGAAMGYLIGYIILFVLLILSSFLMLRKYPMNKTKVRITATETLSASFPAWLPNILTVLGSQLGVIVVQGISGATESGLYFISYSLFVTVMAIPLSITGIAFPLMSGMSGGRIDAAAKTIRMGLVASLPFAVILSAYPGLILGIFGAGFIAANRMLTLFMIGIPLLIVANGILTYVYAEGRYLTALAIGLVSELPKVLFYALLIPQWGGTGASVAYLLGTAISFSAACLASLRMSLHLHLHRYFMIVAIPASVGLISLLLSIPPFVGILLIILISSFGYARLNLLQRTEIREMMLAIMSHTQADALFRRITPMLDLLYGR